jgi:hypothetical protein
MELLVVVGIIIILTALSVPAISKFLGGRSLLESGRVVQSAFAEARRAAVAQRETNYLILVREQDEARPGEYLHGLRRWREGLGYEGRTHFLLAGTEFEVDLDPDAEIHGLLKGALQTPVFDGTPLLDLTPSVSAPAPALTAPYNGLQFRRDGTMVLGTGSDLPPEAHGGSHLWDKNIEVNDLSLADFDALPQRVDMSIIGDTEDERCVIDISRLTGRARTRVVQYVGLTP